MMSCGSVSEAAARLRTSQPTASRMLSDFERLVGFQLFFRKANRLHPTPEAHDLFRVVHQNYTCLDHLVDLTRRMAENQAGSLRISAAPSVAMSVLPVALKRFIERYPGVGTTLEVRTPQSIVRLVDDGEFDLGITASTFSSEVLSITPLMRVQGVCIMRSDHPLASLELIRPPDLVNYPFIALGKTSVTRQRIDILFEQFNVRLKTIAETQNASVACALVSQDMGVSILDELTAGTIAIPNVVHRPLHPPVEIDFVTIVPRLRPNARVTAPFVAILQETIQEMGYGRP